MWRVVSFVGVLIVCTGAAEEYNEADFSIQKLVSSSGDVCMGAQCMASVAPRGPRAVDTISDDVFASMHSMWLTPVLTSSLDHPDGKGFNDELSRFADELFRIFIEDVNGTTPAINDPQRIMEFQRWQERNPGIYADVQAQPEFAPAIAYLRAFFVKAAWHYLNKCGIDTMKSGFRERLGEMQVWTHVHYGGSYEASFHTPRGLVSGAYYARTPIGSGSVVFEDPRGPRAPFSNSLTLNPSPGAFVLFPSWLQRHVEASHVGLGNARVSFSFTLPGPGEELGDISLTG